MSNFNFLNNFFPKRVKTFSIKKENATLLNRLKNEIEKLTNEIKNLKAEKNKVNIEIDELNKEVLHLQDLKKFTEDYLKSDTVQELARKHSKLEKENSRLSSQNKKLLEEINKLSFQKALYEDEIEELVIKKNNLFTSENFSNMSIDYIDSLPSGLEFEKCFANILKKLGYESIEITSGSGDFGIDVLAKKEDILYGFQCKLYSNPVGNDAVQQAYSGKQHYSCNVVIVVTNNYFSPQAQQQARELQVVLWDRKNLEKKIKDIKNPQT